jgi:hypothetical protein
MKVMKDFLVLSMEINVYILLIRIIYYYIEIQNNEENNDRNKYVNELKKLEDS